MPVNLSLFLGHKARGCFGGRSRGNVLLLLTIEWLGASHGITKKEIGVFRLFSLFRRNVRGCRKSLELGEDFRETKPNSAFTLL